MGEAVRQAAQRNLGTRRIGRNKSYGATKSRKLAKSLTVKRDGTKLSFGSPLPYAAFIHFGVSGTDRKVENSPFKYTNKMPPIKPILKWLKAKPVRLRDKKGRFKKQTESAMKSFAFMIARSIKRKGIPKLAYFTEAWETEAPRWESQLLEAAALDFMEGLDDPNKKK